MYNNIVRMKRFQVEDERKEKNPKLDNVAIRKKSMEMLCEIEDL